MGKRELNSDTLVKHIIVGATTKAATQRATHSGGRRHRRHDDRRLRPPRRAQQNDDAYETTPVLAMAMDQLDDDYMEDAQPHDPPAADDDGYEGVDGSASQGGDPGAALVAHEVPRTLQVARRLDRQYPEKPCVHTPCPAGARTRSARGQGQRPPRRHTTCASANVRPTPTSPPPQPAPEQQPMLQDVLAAIAKSRSHTINRLDDLSKVQQMHTGEIRTLDERTTRMQQAIDADRATTEALAARISQLEQTNSRQSSSVPSSRTSGSERGRGPPTDPYASDRTILWVSTSSTVSLQAKQMALTPLIERASCPTTEVELRGSQMGRAFTMRLRPGARGNAEGAINAIMAARRLPDGTRAKVDIQTPYGAALPVYIERDKSYAQRKTAFHLSSVARTPPAAFTTRTLKVDERG